MPQTTQPQGKLNEHAMQEASLIFRQPTAIMVAAAAALSANRSRTSAAVCTPAEQEVAAACIPYHSTQHAATLAARLSMSPCVRVTPISLKSSQVAQPGSGPYGISVPADQLQPPRGPHQKHPTSRMS